MYSSEIISVWFFSFRVSIWMFSASPGNSIKTFCKLSVSFTIIVCVHVTFLPISISLWIRLDVSFVMSTRVWLDGIIAEIPNLSLRSKIVVPLMDLIIDVPIPIVSTNLIMFMPSNVVAEESLNPSDSEISTRYTFASCCFIDSEIPKDSVIATKKLFPCLSSVTSDIPTVSDNAINFDSWIVVCFGRPFSRSFIEIDSVRLTV